MTRATGSGPWLCLRMTRGAPLRPAQPACCQPGTRASMGSMSGWGPDGDDDGGPEMTPREQLAWLIVGALVVAGGVAVLALLLR